MIIFSILFIYVVIYGENKAIEIGIEFAHIKSENEKIKIEEVSTMEWFP